MDRLQSMRVFQQVVDEGGFAAAARKLDLAPAAVTRLVSGLEKHLGVRLLQRTTRRLSLTPAGEAYLARLRTILSDIDEADAVVRTVIETRSVFCAAPEYLRRNGEPREPQELVRHRCLRLRAEGTRLRSMTLIDPSAGDRRLEVDVPAAVTANHTDALMRATV